MQEKYKKLKHEIQRGIRQAYWTYIEDIIRPDDNSNQYGNMKCFSSFIKHKRTDGGGIAPIKVAGKLVTSAIDRVTALNAQFQSVFSKQKASYTSTIAESIIMNNDLDNCEYSALSSLDISINGVTKLLKNLKPRKAPEPDNIKPLAMKETANIIAPGLTAIFKKLLDTGEVPEDWRTANVTPIFKKGTRYTASNYRPVSLTCISSKFMEHIVLRCIMDHADKNIILHSFQYGFRPSRSCESQLLPFTDNVSKNLDNHIQTDILIMDFSKAFDKVDHSLLCYKLKKYGIRGKINGWIKGFLSNRKQHVVVEGESSSYVPVVPGVPQGSAIGPALFLLYINDISEGLNSTCRLFADDAISYLTVNSTADAKPLQDDLDELARWEQRWGMEFQPDKCKVPSISGNKTPIEFEYILHGHELEHVTNTKYLGVIFNRNSHGTKTSAQLPAKLIKP